MPCCSRWGRSVAETPSPKHFSPSDGTSNFPRTLDSARVLKWATSGKGNSTTKTADALGLIPQLTAFRSQSLACLERIANGARSQLALYGVVAFVKIQRTPQSRATNTHFYCSLCESSRLSSGLSDICRKWRSIMPS